MIKEIPGICFVFNAKQVEHQPIAREFFKRAGNWKSLSVEQVGVLDFFRNEVDLVAAVNDDYLFPGIGTLSTILVGQWCSHKETGLYVRTDTNGLNAVLMQTGPTGSGTEDWAYESRLDLRNREASTKLGLFQAINLPHEQIGRALQLTTKFNDAMYGYLLVAQSRR